MSRDHRGVTWERQLARSTRSYIGTAVERAVEDNITCCILNQNSHFWGVCFIKLFDLRPPYRRKILDAKFLNFNVLYCTIKYYSVPKQYSAVPVGVYLYLLIIHGIRNRFL